MNTEENKQTVLRFNKEVLEKGNADVINELFADDFINRTAANGVPNDIEGMKGFIKMFHAAFTDFYVDIHDMIAENDLVSTRKTIHATHVGEIRGHKASGKRVTFNVIDMVRLHDGKYIEHWGRNDIAQVIESL